MLIIIPSLIILVIAIAITYAVKAIDKKDKNSMSDKKVVKEKQLFKKEDVECC